MSRNKPRRLAVLLFIAAMALWLILLGPVRAIHQPTLAAAGVAPDWLSPGALYVPCLTPIPFPTAWADAARGSGVAGAVAPLRCYLPVLTNCYCPPKSAVQDGGFEMGAFGCWQHGGESRQAILDRLDDGEPPRSGRYCAALGAPVSCEAHPQAEAWMYQDVDLPIDARMVTVAFTYRVVSNDILGWAAFSVELRTLDNVLLKRILTDGYDPPDRIAICAYDLGWRSYNCDLTPYAGGTVRLWFSSRNNWDGGLGIWTFVDDVSLTIQR